MRDQAAGGLRVNITAQMPKLWLTTSLHFKLWVRARMWWPHYILKMPSVWHLVKDFEVTWLYTKARDNTLLGDRHLLNLLYIKTWQAKQNVWPLFYGAQTINDSKVFDICCFVASLWLKLKKKVNKSCHRCVSDKCTNLLCSGCISDGLQQECDLVLTRDGVIGLLKRKLMDSGEDETCQLVHAYRITILALWKMNIPVRVSCSLNASNGILHMPVIPHMLWHILNWNRCWGWFIIFIHLYGWSTSMDVAIEKPVLWTGGLLLVCQISLKACNLLIL